MSINCLRDIRCWNRHRAASRRRFAVTGLPESGRSRPAAAGQTRSDLNRVNLSHSRSFMGKSRELQNRLDDLRDRGAKRSVLVRIQMDAVYAAGRGHGISIKKLTAEGLGYLPIGIGQQRIWFLRQRTSERWCLWVHESVAAR
jgi:hypothetical protein